MAKFEEKITINGDVTICEVQNLETGEVFVGKATRQGCDKNDYNLGLKIAKSKAHIKKCERALDDNTAEYLLLINRLEELAKEYTKYETEKENREEFLESLKD